MPAIKAKSMRLIDILGVMNLDEYVLVTYNRGRNTYSGTVENVENTFRKMLGSEIKALTADGSTIKIYI